MRLQTRISMALLAVALVPLVAVMLLALEHDSREAHRLNLQSIQNLMLAKAERVSGYFQERKQEIATYAAMPAIRRMQYDKVDGYLKDELSRHKGIYEKFIVADLDGHFYNTAGGNPHRQGFRTFDDRDPNAKLKSIHQRDYWQVTVGNNRAGDAVVYVSEPMISYTTGVRQIVVAATIFDENNNIAGMIGGALPWSEIHNHANAVREQIQTASNSEAKVILVSGQGHYIYHWDQAKVIDLKRDKAGKVVLNDIGEKTIVKYRIKDSEIAAVREAGVAMSAGESGHVQYTETNSNEEMMMVYAPIAATGYSLAMMIPEKTIHASSIRLRKFFFIVVLAAIGIIILVSLLVSKKIAKPVIDLRHSARQIANGNYHLKVKATGSAELTELSDSFNEMSEALARREELLLQSREKLEQRVKERTQELSEARENAELANKSKSLFLSNMSHELRSPISVMLGTLVLLENTRLDAIQKSYIAAAYKSGKHLLHLITDILDFSKHETGNIVLEPTDFSLAQLIADVQSANLTHATEKGLTLTFDVDDTIDPYIHTDRLRVWQVLMNLIGNAIKFTEQGGVEVKVSKVENKQDDMVLQFDVIDSGIGIAQDALQNIFEVFEQGDMQANRRYAGTGLGLALCRHIVKLMQGELTVDSQPGQGSHFSFRIKCDRATTPTITQNDRNQSVTFSGKVLLAEDNQVNQMVIEGILSSIGLTIDIVNNGEQCVKQWQSNRYDVILMDMQMPVMDGVEATRIIREQEQGASHIPIIALTANVYKQDKEACFEAGMDGFLSKPINTDHLYETLGQWLKPA